MKMIWIHNSNLLRIDSDPFQFASFIIFNYYLDEFVLRPFEVENFSPKWGNSIIYLFCLCFFRPPRHTDFEPRIKIEIKTSMYNKLHLGFEWVFLILFRLLRSKFIIIINILRINRFVLIGLGPGDKNIAIANTNRSTLDILDKFSIAFKNLSLIWTQFLLMESNTA